MPTVTIREEGEFLTAADGSFFPDCGEGREKKRAPRRMKEAQKMNFFCRYLLSPKKEWTLSVQACLSAARYRSLLLLFSAHWR